MDNLEKSRMFWKRIIGAIEIIMAIGGIFILYCSANVPFIGPITANLLLFALMGGVFCAGQYLTDELDRQLPPPERIFLED